MSQTHASHSSHFGSLALAALGWAFGQFWDGILPVLLALLLTSVLWPAKRA